MSEYISKTELKQKVKKHLPTFYHIVDEVIDCTMTSVDVAPVAHGHWGTYAYEDGFVCAVCSACKWSSGAMWWGYAIKHFDFCPHCGAKMDESEANNNERT